MEPSVFTKIIRGEIPAHKIYEDDRTIAFLTIAPIMEGHVLVVSKLQTDDFEALPIEDYQALFATVKKVTDRVKKAYLVKKAVISIMGFEVPHAHVHIMPCNSEDEFYDAVENRGKSPAPNQDQLAAVAEKLRF